MPAYRIRAATLDDLDTLVQHRLGMFTAMGTQFDHEILERATRDWLRRTIPSGDYFAWVCETEDGEIVAGAGVSLFRWPPGPMAAHGDQMAFVYNVYTEPAHRKQGLARKIMGTVHTWCADRGIPALALNAARDARHLYDSMGYVEAPNPMMWKIL